MFTIGAIKKNFAVHGRQFGLSLNISGHIVQALDEIGNGLQKRFIAFVKIKDGGFSTVERKLTYAYHRWRWFLRLQRKKNVSKSVTFEQTTNATSPF